MSERNMRAEIDIGGKEIEFIGQGGFLRARLEAFTEGEEPIDRKMVIQIVRVLLLKYDITPDQLNLAPTVSAADPKTSGPRPNVPGDGLDDDGFQELGQPDDDGDDSSGGAPPTAARLA